MRGLVVSAPSSGQGKTVLTLGLIRALREAGLRVSSAKSGPDYIDPAFHAAATGQPCLTLDSWAADGAQLRARAGSVSPTSEFLIVEGAMGLFDGPARSADRAADQISGQRAARRGSTAAVADALGLPVILVADASGQGQTLGAVISGLSGWLPGLRIAGVILNRVASRRHGRMLRDGLSGVCPVLGEVPRDADLTLPSRHLGLVQAGETEDLEAKISRAAARIAASCDLDAIRDAAAPVATGGPARRFLPPGQRIALARDAAFSFSYWHQAEDWRAQGAEVIPFSPLADEAPDESADAIVLPGGYPELHAGVLAQAERVRTGIARAIARDAVIYGECGGYMVLGDHLVDQDGTAHAMYGALRLTTSFEKRTRHLGYRTVAGRTPFGERFAAHEFHYSTVIEAKGQPLFATVTDGEGAAMAPMGLRDGRVMGSFAHLIEPAD